MHTDTRLTGHGCVSSPHLSVQDPLSTHPCCRGLGYPHISLGPPYHHLLPPPGGEPAPQGVGSRGAHSGSGEAGGSCWGYPQGGGWHCQAPAEPLMPWDLIRPHGTGVCPCHTGLMAAAFTPDFLPLLQVLKLFSYLFSRWVLLFEKYHGKFLVATYSS